MSALRVAVLAGTDIEARVAWDRSDSVAIKGNNDSWRLIKMISSAQLQWQRFHITPTYFRQNRRWDFTGYDLLYNKISDADQNPKTLAVAARVAKSTGLRCINEPKRVLMTTREAVATRLHGIRGVRMPRTVRIQKPTRERIGRSLEAGAFALPAIVRRAGLHSGRIVGVFSTLEEFSQIYGDMKNEYYVTEFYDFRWPDGLYRKFRFFVIGGEIVFRHMLVSDRWNVHAHNRSDFMQGKNNILEEERQYMTHGIASRYPECLDVLVRIAKEMGLDYFGIDCSFSSPSEVVVFEVNATMNFFPFNEAPEFDYVRECLDPAVTAMQHLLFKNAATRAA